ncbi:hypothetical protein D0N87_32720, partial [Pseudomonas sp. ATCC 13867]
MAEIHLAQQAATPQSRGELRAAVDAFRHALDARMPSEVLLKSARESRRRFALACLKLPAQMHLRILGLMTLLDAETHS